jgi:hypothetical protein
VHENDACGCTVLRCAVLRCAAQHRYRGTPAKIHSILEAFQSRAAAATAAGADDDSHGPEIQIRLVHARGVKTGCHPPACNGAECPAFNASCATRGVVVNQTERIMEAAAAATSADFAILTLVPSPAGESHDRETIDLPPVEAEMLRAVAGACRNPRRHSSSSSGSGSSGGDAGGGTAHGGLAEAPPAPAPAAPAAATVKDCRLISVLLGDGSLSDEKIWSSSDAVLTAFEAGQGGVKTACVVERH